MRALGCIPAAARLVVTLSAPDDPNRRGSSYAVTVITPIRPGETDALRSVLRRFEARGASPLAKVPDVQFARWVVIAQLRTEWRGAPKPPPRLRSQYLLFSADVTPPAYRADALPGAFFRDVARHMPTASAEVWGKCLGFPGVGDAEAFAKYLADSQIEMSLYYAAYPDATAADISHAVLVRRELAEFALAHQGAQAPQTMKEDYLEASASW